MSGTKREWRRENKRLPRGGGTRKEKGRPGRTWRGGAKREKKRGRKRKQRGGATREMVIVGARTDKRDEVKRKRRTEDCTS